MSLKQRIPLALKRFASYPDLHLEIDNAQRLKTPLYDKRDHIIFVALFE
jgi:hypothetical protein